MKPKTGTSMVTERRSRKNKEDLKHYHKASGKKVNAKLDKLKSIWNQDVVNRHINNDHMKKGAAKND